MGFKIKNGVLERCEGDDTVVVIPDGVTAIGSFAFHNCYKMEKAVIPEGVTVIDSYAFSGCERLKEVVFPSTLTRIYSSAFSRCEKLGKITLPKSVIVIGDDAFYGCDNLDITLHIYGNNLRRTLYKIFGEYTRIREIHAVVEADAVNENAEKYSPGVSTFRLPLYSLTIPDGVQELGLDGFRGFKFSDLYIPSSLKKSHVGTFHHGGARRVHITDMDAWLNIDYYGSECQPLYYTHGELYLNGELVKEVVIPSGCTQVNESVFAGCSSLESVVIPEGVTAIERNAFAECKNLKAVTLPSTLKAIKSGAFSGCSALTEIKLPEGLEAIEHYAFFECSGIKFINIPQNTVKIEDSAFKNCKSLATVTLPSNITVAQNAFEGCGDIQFTTTSESECEYDGNILVSCPQGATSITIKDGITEIASYAFRDCALLTEIVIPEGVTKLGSFVFSGCKKLKKLILPSTITEVDFDTFNALCAPDRSNAPRNYLPVPELIGGGENAKALKTLLDAGNRYCSEYGSVSVLAALLGINGTLWKDGGRVKFANENGVRKFVLTMEHSYIAEYSDHESGMDRYETEYITYEYIIPDNVADCDAVIYAVTHLNGWKKVGSKKEDY